MRCQHCGDPLTGQKTKYCGQTCANRAFNARRKADGRLAAQRVQLKAKRAEWKKANARRYMVTRECDACGQAFTHRDGDPTTTCSVSCGVTLHHLRKNKSCTVIYRHCLTCTGVLGTTRGHRLNYHPGCRPNNPRVKIPQSTRDLVFIRDKGICWLCRIEVPVDVPRNDPLRASMDHVVPRSRGGKHNAENLRLAHLICNSLRQDKPIAA